MKGEAMITLDDLLEVAPLLDPDPKRRVGTLVAMCRPPSLEGRCAQRLAITEETTFADVAYVLARRAHVKTDRPWRALLDEGWVVSSAGCNPSKDGPLHLPPDAPLAEVLQPGEPIVIEWDLPYSPDWRCTYYPEGQEEVA
jgi:hypothetical protein